MQHEELMVDKKKKWPVPACVILQDVMRIPKHSIVQSNPLVRHNAELRAWHGFFFS